MTAAEKRRVAAAAAIINRARGRISGREVARRAGISEGWYRQVMAGEQKRGRASVPIVGSDQTWLAICRAVRANPAEVFAALGRPVPDVGADTDADDYAAKRDPLREGLEDEDVRDLERYAEYLKQRRREGGG